ncbi:MAG: hypothetical protein LBQ44_10120, partial [Treponema sp.]|nr:hypothetical protein [Treponema sp.]
MKKFLLPALFFLCVFPAFSQVGGVSAPFVSRLEAEVKNGFIRLSWDDSPDIRGPVYVYRSETPMTSFAAGSLPNPARVPYGTESYLDEAEKPGTFYYFAVVSDEQGEKYMLFTATVVVTVKEGDVAEFFRDPSLAGAYTPPPPPPPGAAEQGPAGPMPEDDVNAGNFAIRRGSSAAGAAA